MSKQSRSKKLKNTFKIILLMVVEQQRRCVSLKRYLFQHAELHVQKWIYKEMQLEDTSVILQVEGSNQTHLKSTTRS